MAKQGKKAARNSKTMERMLAMQVALATALLPTSANGAVGGWDLVMKRAQPMQIRSVGRNWINAMHSLSAIKWSMTQRTPFQSMLKK